MMVNKEAAASLEHVHRCSNRALFLVKVENFSSINDSVLTDPPVILRNFPWKIMIQKRGTEAKGFSMGCFLQCNGESEETNWSCYAKASLKLINQSTGVKFPRSINHMFFSGENDWGFGNFMSWNEVQDPEKGYIKDDCVIFEVAVEADAEFDGISCGNSLKDFVKIDFELTNWKTRKGVTLSPSVRFGDSWWRFRIEFLNKMLKVSLVCEGLKSHGGCSSQWSCEVTGSVALVNQLDDDKNRVERFANKKLSNKAQALVFSDMIKIDSVFDHDSGFAKNGSIVLMARVVASQFHTINSSRFAEMLERRKNKEVCGDGAKIHETVAKQSKQKKKKQAKRKKIVSITKKTLGGNQSLEDEEEEQPKWVDSLENFWDKALASKFPKISLDYLDKDPEGEEDVVECSIGKLVVEGTGTTKEAARENAAQYMFSLIENILENEGTDTLKKNIIEGEDSEEAAQGGGLINQPPPFKGENETKELPVSQSVSVDGGLAGDLNENQETERNSVEVPQQDELGIDEDKSLRIIKKATSEDIVVIGHVSGLKADTIDNDGEEVEQNLCQSLHPTGVNGESTGKERKRKPSGKCSLPSCTETGRHRCSRCLSVSYCSQLCNDQNWREHREQCKDFMERDREDGVD